MSNKRVPFPDFPARMSEEEFWALFGRRESGQVEFKERTEKPGKLQATLAAFAGLQGF